MRIIGLTGGIASGKTAVSTYFQSLHIPIIDADVIARALTEPHQPAYQAIVAHFGKTILHGNTERIDRPYLRQLVFNNAEQKSWVEQLLHPLIQADIVKQITQLKLQLHPYCVVVIPLLNAKNKAVYAFLDEIISVEADASLRQQRLLERDHIQPDLARAMLQAQVDDAERLQFATHVVDNSRDINYLHQQLQVLHLHWKNGY